MDSTSQVQILDEVDCIEHCTNTHVKGMNRIIISPAEAEFRLVKRHLKIEIVSNPARAEGFIYIYIYIYIYGTSRPRK